MMEWGRLEIGLANGDWHVQMLRLEGVYILYKLFLIHTYRNIFI